MADDMDIEEEGSSLSSPEIVDKYKTAAIIANQALAQVISQCNPGARVAELCALGDSSINDALSKCYAKDKKMDKAIAFPTCVSANHCVGHFSPLNSNTAVLADGDVVKVELGVHIDGHIAVVGHTCFATSTPAVATTGRKADVVCAAHFAAEAAHRMLRPGRKNTEVTAMIAKVAEAFNCKPVESVASHQMKRFVVDAKKSIANKENPDAPQEECTFEEGEVYAIDIVMSTGEGKVHELDIKPTIFKRSLDVTYSLKMKASRALLSEATKKYSTVPFSTRNLATDERQVKLGLTECLKHDLLEAYPVLFEKDGEIVAQMKFTVLILPSSIDRITTHAPPNVNSSFQITDPKVSEILAMGTKRSKKKKKKSKGGEAGADDVSMES